MKTKMNWKSVVAAAGIACTLVACNQDNAGLLPQDENTAALSEDNQLIVDETEGVFSYNDDLFGGLSNLRESGADSAGPGKRPLKGDKCATVTRSESNGVVTVVIDYGSVKDCDGRKVGGKMTIQIPLKPGDNASGLFTQMITYENFQRGPRILNGKHTVSLVLENGRLVTKESFTEMILTTEDGKTVKFSSTKTRKTDAKGTPLNLNDDEIVVTGTISAVGSDGKSFNSAITKGLVTKISCRSVSGVFPVAGTIEIQRSGESKVVVDYGDGTCDRTYTVTANGKTETKIRK